MSVVSSRKEREKLERRSSIIAAARECFSRNGFKATTIDEIAEKAELSKGAIYLYFTSKDDLYVSIVVDDFWSIEAGIVDVLGSGGDLITRGRSMYMSFVDHCLENRDYVRITQHFLNEGERKSISPGTADKVTAQTSKLLGYISEMIAEGKRAGRIREDVDPAAFGIVAWRMTVGLLELVYSQDFQGLDIVDGGRNLFEAAYDILVGGIRNTV
jgi:AcrR family transcriptional regulator